MTKPHKHAEFLHLFLDGQDVSDWEAVPGWHKPNHTVIPGEYALSIMQHPEEWNVRRKPKTIRIGEMDVPPPMREAPAMGTVVWLVCIHTDPPYRYSWSGTATEQKWLKLGICHLTKEAAEQHRKALILVSGGTP